MTDNQTEDQIREALACDSEPQAENTDKAQPLAFIPDDGIEDVDFDAPEPEVPEEAEPDTEAQASAVGVLGAMNFDQGGAETGVWFPWPKFGAKARLRIAFIGCQRHLELMKKARRKFGKVQKDGNWKLEAKDLQRLIPAVYAQAIFTGLEEVPLGRCVETPNYSLVREDSALRLTVKSANKVFHFEALDERPENYLADTEQNRHRLLLAFQPELENDIYGVATKRANFRDREIVEAIRGN